MSKPIIPLVAFVDWNFHVYRTPRSGAVDAKPKDVFQTVMKSLERGLAETFKNCRFKVQLRLYHGWHKGFERTPRRKALAGIDSAQLADWNNCIWISYLDPQFGDSALAAIDARICARTSTHYPATLRDQGATSPKECMVDTSLVSDLVYCAADKSDRSWLAVMGEDIDLVPGIFTAEALLRGTERRIAFIGKDATTEKFVNLKNLATFQWGAPL